MTQEVKAFAMEQAGRRCECTGQNCRHHLKGARCKRGLRGDQWRVFWRSEGGGLNRDNIEAWCLECFGNNFQVPRESVALLSLDIHGYTRVIEEDEWRAVTLRAALRDAALRSAREHGGDVVLSRVDDDILLKFPTSPEALEATRGACSSFRETVNRLNLGIPELHGALHYGEVTPWRSGIVVGDAVAITISVRSLAEQGQLMLTEPAAAPLGSVELEPIAAEAPESLGAIGQIWALRL
jgi:class 3 adenylate cyclase